MINPNFAWLASRADDEKMVQVNSRIPEGTKLILDLLCNFDKETTGTKPTIGDIVTEGLGRVIENRGPAFVDAIRAHMAELRQRADYYEQRAAQLTPPEA